MHVTIDLDAYDQLPPRQLRAMLRALRFADGAGIVRATLSQLAMPGLSRSAVHRNLAELERAGDRYRIPIRFRSVPTVPTAGTPPVPTAETTVPEAGTTDSRARAFKNLSSVSKETSERALSQETIQENLSEGWAEAARAERQRAGLPDVDLHAEWRKHRLWYAERSRPVRLGGWLLWAVRTRLDHTNTPAAPTGLTNAAISLPGSDQERARARSWAKTGRWAPPGIDWGPPPDQPGSTLPAALVAWCREQRRDQ